MVANGHSWSSIKKYTLSEIGTFFKTIVLLEREKKAQNISDIWQGNNLSVDGLKIVLKSLGSEVSNKEPEAPQEKVDGDWKRLFSDMSRQWG